MGFLLDRNPPLSVRLERKGGKMYRQLGLFASMLINNSLQKRAGGEWLRSPHTAGDKQTPPSIPQKRTFNTLIPTSLHKQTDYPGLLSARFKHNDHAHTFGRDVTVSKMAGSYISVGMGIYSWLVLISQLMPCLIQAVLTADTPAPAA